MEYTWIETHPSPDNQVLETAPAVASASKCKAGLKLTPHLTNQVLKTAPAVASASKCKARYMQHMIMLTRNMVQ